MTFKQQYLLCDVCQTHSLSSGLVDGVCVCSVLFVLIVLQRVSAWLFFHVTSFMWLAVF